MMTTIAKSRIDADELKRFCLGREVDILADVAGIPRERLDGHHGPCHQCGGTDRARWNPEKKFYYCNGCFSSGNGDIIAVVVHFRGVDFPTALELIADYVGFRPASKNGSINGHAKSSTNGFISPAKSPNASDELRKKFIPYGTSTAAARNIIDGHFKTFCERKPPITIEAIKAANVTLVTWPPSNEYGYLCLAVPAYLWPGEPPVAYLLRRVDGEVHPASGKLGPRKSHTLGGSKKGWIIGGGFDRLQSAEIVLRVEGEADLLAVHSSLPSNWVVVTNSGGAKAVPDNLDIFKDKKAIYSLGDADKPGEEGAIKFASKVQTLAEFVSRPQLPYEIAPEHGKDLRNYLNDGHTFDDLRALCESTPAFEKPQGKKSNQRDAASKDDAKRIVNFKIVAGETSDGKETLEKEPLPIGEIATSIMDKTGRWPRRVGKSLFVRCDGRDGVAWIPDADAMFSFLGFNTGTPPEMAGGAGFHSRREVFSHFTRMANDYVAVEPLPHEPQIAGHFYACDIPQSGNCDRLRELLDRFTPYSDIDRDLIMAAFVTPFWGGRGGCRPAFCFTSPDGKGAGKSKLAGFVANLCGGAIDFSANDEIGDMKKRFLSPGGLAIRAALFDNIKSHRFSWAELESLVTAPVISGHAMYVGESARPNNITYFLTMNGASLSADMAQRTVVIQVRKPSYSGTWFEDTQKFIDDHRKELIADIMGFLRSPVGRLEKFSRWGDWEREVLARLPEPSETQAVIRERQVGVDVDAEESALIEEFFMRQLTALNYDVETDCVFIPSSVAARWFGWATGERVSTSKASRIMRQRITEGQFQRLREIPRKDLGRGFQFWGTKSTNETVLQYDVEAQIKIKGESHAP